MAYAEIGLEPWAAPLPGVRSSYRGSKSPADESVLPKSCPQVPAGCWQGQSPCACCSGQALCRKRRALYEEKLSTGSRTAWRGKVARVRVCRNIALDD